MSHTLTITKVPDEVDDDYEFATGGDCDDACGVWFVCDRDDCPTQGEDFDNPDGEGTYHGEEHQFIENYWMTKSTRCAIEYSDNLHEAIDGHDIGTYDIEIDYQGDGQWYFDLTERNHS